MPVSSRAVLYQRGGFMHDDGFVECRDHAHAASRQLKFRLVGLDGWSHELIGRRQEFFDGGGQVVLAGYGDVQILEIKIIISVVIAGFGAAAGQQVKVGVNPSGAVGQTSKIIGVVFPEGNVDSLSGPANGRWKRCRLLSGILEMWALN